MPRNIAEFQIIGQVGKVDERENVTHASIAANYNRQVDGEWQSETYWNRVTCFGRAKEQAERAEVGDLVRVTGKMKQTSYDREGETVFTVDLIADSFSVLARKDAAEKD